MNANVGGDNGSSIFYPPFEMLCAVRIDGGITEKNSQQRQPMRNICFDFLLKTIDRIEKQFFDIHFSREAKHEGCMWYRTASLYILSDACAQKTERER